MLVSVFEAGVYIRILVSVEHLYLVILRLSYNNKNRPNTDVHRTINNSDTVCINTLNTIIIHSRGKPTVIIIDNSMTDSWCYSVRYYYYITIT